MRLLLLLCRPLPLPPPLPPPPLSWTAPSERDAEDAPVPVTGGHIFGSGSCSRLAAAAALVTAPDLGERDARRSSNCTARDERGRATTSGTVECDSSPSATIVTSEAEITTFVHKDPVVLLLALLLPPSAFCGSLPRDT